MYLISSVTGTVFFFLEFDILAMDKNPKCFTRHQDDFTCFWEAPVGKSYYFLYIIDQ